MCNIIDIQAFKVNRNVVKYREQCADIQREISEFESALEIVDILSQKYRIRLAKYLMTHHVKFSDLGKKDDSL